MRRLTLRRELINLLGSLSVAAFALWAFLAVGHRHHLSAFILFAGGSGALAVAAFWLRSHGRRGTVAAVILAVAWLLLIIWLRVEAAAQHGERIIWPTTGLFFGINVALAVREVGALVRRRAQPEDPQAGRSAGEAAELDNETLQQTRR